MMVYVGTLDLAVSEMNTVTHLLGVLTVYYKTAKTTVHLSIPIWDTCFHASCVSLGLRR